jgi:TetR/AcrR family transcriptional regulator
MVSKRDSERTRRAILDAAAVEFCALGPAGARVDAIAAGAGVNKRMLYHYFGSKDGLLAAVLNDRLVAAPTPRIQTSLVETLVAHCERAAAQPEAIRLLMWEALADDGGEVVGQVQREKAWRERFDPAGGDAAIGEADAAQLRLLIASVAMFPFAFPQLTRLITGQAARDPAFIAAHSAFLIRFIGRGAERPALERSAARKPRVRLAAAVTETPSKPG